MENLKLFSYYFEYDFGLNLRKRYAFLFSKDHIYIILLFFYVTNKNTSYA